MRNWSVFGEKNATKDAEIRVAQMSSVHQKILAIEKKMAALGHERIRLMTQCDREMKTHVAATHASTIVLRNNHNENPTTCPLWYTLSHSDDIMFTSMDHLDVLSLRNLRQVLCFYAFSVRQVPRTSSAFEGTVDATKAALVLRGR